VLIISVSLQISRLQGVENELWVALLLTSSVIKPLTAPELAAIFSALALNEQQKKKFVPNKVEPLFKAPKRIQLALGKLATLREEALALQGFDNPPLCFDTSVAASVHAWARGTYWSQLSRYTRYCC
jgi:superfamily II RNA helicase